MNNDINTRLKLIQAGKLPAGYKKNAGLITPKEWGITPLSSCIVEYNEKTTVPNQFPVLTSARRGIMLQSEYYAGHQVTTDDNVGYNVIPRGYITFRSRSDDGKFKFNENTIIDKGIISYFYPVFSFNDNVNHKFMLYLLNETIERQMFPYNEGTAQIVLSLNKLKKLQYALPPIDEQRKIADILTAQDKVIKLKNEAIAQKMTYKTLLAEQLSTGEKRLKGFSGKWNKKKLSDFACLLTESLNPFEDPDCIYSVYSLPAFDNDRTPELQHGSEISTNKFKVKSGLILFNKLNVRQKRVWLIEDDAPNTMIASTEFLPLSVHDINKGFLLNLLLSDTVTNYLKKKSSGTSNSQKRILPKDLLSLSIKVPPLPEQDAIAKVLSIVDREINLLQKDLEQEKLKKKSLMQLLLTGIVRVSA